MTMMTMKHIVTVLYIIHLFHGGNATTSDSDSLGLDDETIEISDESDSYSFEELTTVSNSLTLPVQQSQKEVIPPIQTQIATVLEMITQTASPLLMKLIAPIDLTDSSLETIPTEAPVDVLDYNGNINDSNEAESETVTAKKPRLLLTANPPPVSKERTKNLSDIAMEETTIMTMTDVDSENVDISEEITTLIPPLPASVTATSSSTSKRPPKNIEIFKTKPNELLRLYVEDGHLRSPVAALVDKKSNPLGKAKKLWKAALRPNSLLDIMVVSYDSEGIKSTYNLTNTKAMMSTLDKVREENVTDQESKTYYSIIRTGQLIPFDSAIFLSTDELPDDIEHQLQASIFLLKKRIRLYLIIFDNKNLSTSTETTHASIKDTGFLGQLAMITGGDIIYVPNHAFQPDGEMGYITLMRRNKLKAIDQEPLKEVHENELRNDTETLGSVNKEEEHLESHESNN